MFRNSSKYILIFILSVSLAAQHILVSSASYAQIPAASFVSHPLIQGVSLYHDDPLKMDFILDVTGIDMSIEKLSQESLKMARYFLTALTVPKGDMWVNLSPYEPDRIVPENLGSTEMGRDMLAQDLELKTFVAELLSPDHEVGQKFWEKVYQTLGSQTGDVLSGDVESFSKVWIVPDQAVVYASGRNIFITDSYLKVMVEEDYVAQSADARSETNGMSAEVKVIMRSIILPVIEKEVNQGERFASLRQMFHAMILAAWYKQNLKNSILNGDYADLGKVEGIDGVGVNVRQEIYERYLSVFQKASGGLLREVYDPDQQAVAARKYVTGGVLGRVGKVEMENQPQDASRFFQNHRFHASTIRFNAAMMAAEDHELTPEEERRILPFYADSKMYLKVADHIRQSYPDMRVVLFVRHIESFTNVTGKVQAPNAWSPPSGQGERQRDFLTKYMSPLLIDQFLSSKHERAFRTIKPLADLQGKRITTYKRFNEIPLLPIFGGISNSDLRAVLAISILEIFASNPDQFQNEHFDIAWVNRSAKLSFGDNKMDHFPHTTMVATHGITSVYMWMKLLGIPSHKFKSFERKMGGPIPYGGLTGLIYDPRQADGKKWKLLFKPDNSYLPPDIRSKRIFGDLPLSDRLKEHMHFARIFAVRALQMVFNYDSQFIDYYPNKTLLVPPSKAVLEEMVNRFVDGLPRNIADQLREKLLGGPNQEVFQHSGDDSAMDDPAMLKPPGGIDFDANKLTLRTGGQGFEVFFDPAILQKSDSIKGLVPVIIGVRSESSFVEIVGGKIQP